MTTIAKKLAQIKPGTLLAGLDLGLDSIAAVVPACGRQAGRQRAACRSLPGDTESAGIRVLARAVAERHPETGGLRCAGGHGTHEPV